jgi:hypothetical protein
MATLHKNTFTNYSTSGTKVILADPNSTGVYSAIVFERLVINGGTAGAIKLYESANSEVTDVEDTVIADIDPASGVPVSLEYGLVVKGNLLLVLGANTDVTVVYHRIP